MRSFLNIALLLCCSLPLLAQKAATDTVKVKKSYAPTGIRIGTDALSIARNYYDKSFSGWEVNADVDFNRYFLALDYGSWSRTYNKTGSYKNDGNYWRLGADVNFLLKDPEKNMIFFGFRYGHSNFSENLSVVTVDPVWGEFSQNYANTNVNAHWTEITTGIRVKMWKMIWMGYTARLKFGLSYDDTGEMVPHDVPGYGRTDKDTYWGFNYQIFIRLPIRKDKSIPLEK